VIQREEDEEGYEQHSVGDIKQMFNKPDQTGQRTLSSLLYFAINYNQSIGHLVHLKYQSLMV